MPLGGRATEDNCHWAIEGHWSFLPKIFLDVLLPHKWPVLEVLASLGSLWKYRLSSPTSELHDSYLHFNKITTLYTCKLKAEKPQGIPEGHNKG